MQDAGGHPAKMCAAKGRMFFAERRTGEHRGGKAEKMQKSSDMEKGGNNAEINPKMRKVRRKMIGKFDRCNY